MIVKVKNAKNPTLTKLLKLSANFFANQLMSKRLINNLNIQIILQDKLKAGGFCFSEDNGKRQRNFTIDIAKYKQPLRIIRILAHEMVHVKQYAKNELRDVSYKKNSAISWQGKYYIDVLYWDQP